MNEFTWKDVVNALSLANMILGLFSIFCSFCKYVWGPSKLFAKSWSQWHEGGRGLSREQSTEAYRLTWGRRKCSGLGVKG